MLQDAYGITKLICKLETQNKTTGGLHFHSRKLVADTDSQPPVCFFEILCNFQIGIFLTPQRCNKFLTLQINLKLNLFRDTGPWSLATQ